MDISGTVEAALSAASGSGSELDASSGAVSRSFRMNFQTMIMIGFAARYGRAGAALPRTLQRLFPMKCELG